MSYRDMNEICPRLVINNKSSRGNWRVLYGRKEDFHTLFNSIDILFFCSLGIGEVSITKQKTIILPYQKNVKCRFSRSTALGLTSKDSLLRLGTSSYYNVMEMSESSIFGENEH